MICNLYLSFNKIATAFYHEIYTGVAVTYVPLGFVWTEIQYIYKNGITKLIKKTHQLWRYFKQKMNIKIKTFKCMQSLAFYVKDNLDIVTIAPAHKGISREGG